MMKRFFLFSILIMVLASCGSSRKTTKNTTSTSNTKINSVVKHAKSFTGTRYKFGGTDRRGMDCSGLVYVSYKKENVVLPRVSREMAKKGRRIKLKDTRKGDLLFFQTDKNRRVINHVGLVTQNKNGAINFIHSTSSKGVLTSSLKESYWRNAFVEVRRIL